MRDKILENVLNEITMNPLENLLNREIEVAELLANGEENFEISNLIDIKFQLLNTSGFTQIKFFCQEL